MQVRSINRRLSRINRRLYTDDCASDPCQNGGTCIDITTSVGFMCLCTPGFEGTQCNEDINECIQFIGTDLGCQASSVIYVCKMFKKFKRN